MKKLILDIFLITLSFFIFPFQSERSISLNEREAKQKKAHRWQHIAVKAVQQSRRARVPYVGKCRPFKEVLKDCREDGLKVLLCEKGGENLRRVLKQYPTQKIYVMVGPEVGFTPCALQGFVPLTPCASRFTIKKVRVDKVSKK